jgi:hypothetical protein
MVQKILSASTGGHSLAHRMGEGGSQSRVRAAEDAVRCRLFLICTFLE